MHMLEAVEAIASGGGLRRERVDSRRLSLTINRDSGFPIYLQIAHQILHQVESGTLKAGNLLPSIRQQAEFLRTAPLTVDEAYKWLSVRGIVAAERGIGFRISVEANGSKEENRQRAALAEFVELSLAHCRKKGLDPIMFAQAVMARAGVQDRSKGQRQIVFVECQPEYIREYSAALHGELANVDIHIKGLLVSSLPAKVSAKTEAGRVLIEADYVATTLYHYDVLKRLLAPLKRSVLMLSHTLDKDALKRIAALPKGCRLGIILGPVDPATTMVHTIEEYQDLPAGSIPYASMSNDVATRKVIRQSDVIAYTAPCEDLIRKLRVKPENSILMRFVPDQAAVRKVCALVGS